MGYLSATIKITDEIDKLPSSAQYPSIESFYNLMRYKMAHASALCKKERDASYLMRIAIAAIQREREILREQDPLPFDEYSDSEAKSSEDVKDIAFHELTGENVPAFRSAFVIRQIKRPEEVSLLRFVYGDQFILLSGYGTQADRQKILQEKIRFNESGDSKQSREVYLANQLMELDASEDNDEYGQHLREVFHLADVVVDGISHSKMRTDIERFINALFGLNETAPTKQEYGMYSAHSASLRSTDLSRQVGAAIFSREGVVLAQGCNEVPKAFGGTYWDGEEPDYRDIKLGKDSNDVLKMDVLKDLIERMKKNGILSDKVVKAGSPTQIANFLIGRTKGPNEFEDLRGSLKNSKILDLTEYGRVVHAEMNSICDAARTGIPLAGSTLYTTTFPCHNCAKHIIAAGIHEVVFLEPYPKSKAKDLHANEIEIEGDAPEKVMFNFFSGITPARYEKIFYKSKRKKNGIAVRWQYDVPTPMVNVTSPTYMSLEGLVAVNVDPPVIENGA
ncbi:deaminase [Sphingomonas psychrotolerans]|uniref:Deaminase n=1 Tax=Sphingomonas psychrotolerans TaxID=1327635 RepID=A0ABU3N273_9SPHN|nr:deaminase [Sphingomonas psychrotolerans]